MLSPQKKEGAQLRGDSSSSVPVAALAARSSDAKSKLIEVVSMNFSKMLQDFADFCLGCSPFLPIVYTENCFLYRTCASASAGRAQAEVWRGSKVAQEAGRSFDR
jgi:hypothetical protein